MRRAACLLALLALVAVPVARADEQHPTSIEIQNELWCDDCQTTLADASAVSFTPHALAFIQERISQGATKSEIKNEAVDKFRGHLSLTASGTAPKAKASLADLEGEVMCPVCNTTLDQSSSPAAQQIKDFISSRIAAGDTKQQIKDELVADYGPQILAAPPAKGFNLLAWLLPIVGLLAGALLLGLLAWRWTRGPGEPRGPTARLDPALDRLVDQELARFDEG
jgi:cytochrome c-type biogenesis protein CcmH